MRPIDADALVDALMNIGIGGLGLETVVAVQDIARVIREMPTVEPKRGRWVEDGYIYVCSECDGVAMQRMYYDIKHCATDIQMVRTQYCPHCGTRMEQSETDDKLAKALMEKLEKEDVLKGGKP